MNFILRLKHWQVFLVVFAAMILNGFTIEGNAGLTTVLNVAGGLMYFSWILLVGHGLYQLTSSRIDVNYKFFLLNSLVCLSGYVVVGVVFASEGLSLNGVAALPGIYVMYAFFYFTMFPGRTLKSIEKGKTAEIGESIGYFILIVFIAIGVWFLQPRINKVVDEWDSKNVS